MRILIDIGHPAHVHYFKKFIFKMKDRGHKVTIVTRSRPISLRLLNNFGIEYIERGKGKDSFAGKLWYLLIGSFIVLKVARKHKTDFFLSFASPYASIASFFLGKPSIVLDDTEHNHLNHFIYSRTSSLSLHPKGFKKKLGKNQFFFDGTMENAYLADLLPRNTGQKSVKSTSKKLLVRFVSWKATHDKYHSGFSSTEKVQLIEELKGRANIYISSEEELPEALKKYELSIPPHEFHHFLSTIDLFVGESGSIATEAAFLGVPSIVYNSAANEFGVFQKFKELGLLEIAENADDATSKSLKLLDPEVRKKKSLIARQYRNSIVDLVNLLIWFVENYPQSAHLLKENPDYQYKFMRDLREELE